MHKNLQCHAPAGKRIRTHLLPVFVSVNGTKKKDTGEMTVVIFFFKCPHLVA